MVCTGVFKAATLLRNVYLVVLLMKGMHHMAEHEEHMQFTFEFQTCLRQLGPVNE